MCGIAGFLGNQQSPEGSSATLRAMTDQIAHRGPDDEGHWVDETNGVGLGHRRLSIVDLSATGHQPMKSHTGRYQLVLNGEFYNYPEIREELEKTGVRFRGTSDTEVALAAVDRWGVESGIQRLAGMFAIAIWDTREQLLHLVRDRIGEKPVYYANLDGVLVFGSELKALRAHPRWKDEIDYEGLGSFLQFSYVRGTRSIYKHTRKVRPGCIATFRRTAELVGERPYWSAADAARQGAETRLTGDDREVTDLLEAELRRTVRQEFVADVPLGAFLSGGIDSTLVVSLMQAESTRPVRTFTIGFEVAGFNESEFARAVASHLRTDHTEFVVTEQDARDVVPLLPRLYDEPFADSSQIPTHLVSALARRHVTVALSGDGGDEVFGGYGRYTEMARLWGVVGRWPRAARRVAGGTLGLAPDILWGALSVGSRLVGRSRGINPTPERVAKLGRVLASRDLGGLYSEMMTQWPGAASVIRGAPPPNPEALPQVGGLTPVEQLMLHDLTTYLPDDILVKVDRAAMGVSLESRAPFVDHRVVEFAWRIPLSMKIRDGKGKWILRALLDRYVPRELMDRPKMGFGVPLASWLAGPLKAWADDLLDPARLRREGLFDPRPIVNAWSRFRRGDAVSPHMLWTILMFQSWREASVGQLASRARTQSASSVPGTRSA